MCQCRCRYENSITGDCTLPGAICPPAIEARIVEIKEEIEKHENEINELENELEELEW